MNGWKRERKSNGYSVVKLIGHIASSALGFTALFGFGWSVDWVLDLLNATHPFPPDVRAFMSKLALWGVYADAALWAMVLVVGFFRFARELLER